MVGVAGDNHPHQGPQIKIAGDKFISQIINRLRVRGQVCLRGSRPPVRQNRGRSVSFHTRLTSPREIPIAGIGDLAGEVFAIFATFVQAAGNVVMTDIGFGLHRTVALQAAQSWWFGPPFRWWLPAGRPAWGLLSRGERASALALRVAARPPYCGIRGADINGERKLGRDDLPLVIGSVAFRRPEDDRFIHLGGVNHAGELAFVTTRAAERLCQVVKVTPASTRQTGDRGTGRTHADAEKHLQVTLANASGSALSPSTKPASGVLLALPLV